tara:strand:- start:14529 stop:15689 length:1161 start_codon:yes stop_codon:yes gene_type:complete
MFGYLKRSLAVAMATLLLAACQVIPGGGSIDTAPPPGSQNAGLPDAQALPDDEARHRVALLVPLSGSNGEVGQSIANATTMALLDTGADDLRITTYDTAGGAGAAARRAMADGNRLILGPLLRDNVGAVLAQARPAQVPLITFSNDLSAARPDVFVMGHAPEQSVERTANFAIDQGARNFAALVPNGEYGERVLSALRLTLETRNARLLAVERFDRGNRSIISAAGRLRERGGYDTVLIGDGARLAIMAASELKDAGQALPSLIGTELWAGEIDLTQDPEMRGAWFSAVPDERYRQFAQSYESRFGTQPYRISTLGYDAVLLSLRIARDWQPGTPFPTARLTDEGGFIGLDGAFRFLGTGVGERAMEVREVDDGTFSVADPAPARF